MEWITTLEMTPAGLGAVVGFGKNYRHVLNGNANRVAGNRKAVINDCCVNKHLLMYEAVEIAERICWRILKDKGFKELTEAKAVGEAWVRRA